ncbi:F-box domain-containing protein [Mycena kentingensis (nom. inval.)]|nr:F-box domain-containing protein [Mycena kentingensis (nom. inval.)]
MPVHPRSRPGLPVELWRDIFLISVELHLHLDTYSSLSGAFAPLVLTRVCSRWREVALADGRLWRNLVLFHAEKEKTMWIVQRWAERSRPYQLSVRIRSHDSVWIISDDDSAPRFLERVEYLDTVILGDTSKSVFLPTHTTRLPLKELSLDLRTWTLRYQTNLARLLDSLEHATHLRLLSLDYPSLALMPARFPQTSRFPFAQLTTLHLRAQIDDTTLTRFLHCCPLLETLLVPAFFRRFPESGAVVGGQSRIGSTIVLPHLRRLEFSAPSATLMNERCLEFFAGATPPRASGARVPGTLQRRGGARGWIWVWALAARASAFGMYC